MALTLGDNFSYLGAKPLDGRVKYDTIADMVAMSASTLYDGIIAFCVADGKNYQWKSTNDVDETLGKWRELATGGGTGGGHTIKSDGTALTQRDTMNFMGFDVEDDSKDESTNISAHKLTSAEIAEIFEGVPNPTPHYPILFDERGTEYVVGWYVNNSGLKKPIYQKTWKNLNLQLLNNSWTNTTITTNGLSKLIGAVVHSSNGTVIESINCAIDGNYVNINNTSQTELYADSLTLRYTKTTDEYQ